MNCKLGMVLTKPGFAYDQRRRESGGMRSLFRTLISASTLFLPLAQAHAAATAWQEIAGGRIRVVVAEPAPGTKTVLGMLQLDLAPGWKTYWRDPGDAGVPLQVDVSKSTNAALGKVDYPAPHRFDDGVSVWAGYKEPVTFGLSFDRADAAAPLEISGNVFLGVCEKICVPVQYEFDVEVKDSATPTMHHELVAMALKDLPLMATQDFGVETVSTDWHTIGVEANVPDGVDGAELFLAAPEGFQFTAPVLKSQQGGKLHFEAEFQSMSRKYIPDPKIVAYTLVTDGGAVSGEIALSHP
jgi:DsbC/DsbD-like thiol-disulfide interchange protein